MPGIAESSPSGEIVLFADVKNSGKRPVRRVELTAVGYDKQGYATFPSSWCDADGGSLAPGRVTKCVVKLNGKASKWTKPLRVKATNIEFEK